MFAVAILWKVTADVATTKCNGFTFLLPPFSAWGVHMAMAKAEQGKVIINPPGIEEVVQWLDVIKVIFERYQVQRFGLWRYLTTNIKSLGKKGSRSKPVRAMRSDEEWVVKVRRGVCPATAERTREEEAHSVPTTEVVPLREWRETQACQAFHRVV